MRPVLPALLAVALASPLQAAAPPQRGLSLTVPENSSPLLPLPPAPPPRTPQSAARYEPAPLPNRDLNAPLGPRASNSATVAPKLFTRSDQYRGEGFFAGSTAQAEQEKNVKPGAGFNLRMPLTGQ